MLNKEFKGAKAEFDIYIESIMNGERALSFSSFKNFALSPRNFFKNRMFKKTTDAMTEGKQFHMCCLEPDKYNKKYIVLDDTDKCEEIGGAKPRSTAKYKAWKAEQLFEIESKGREIVDKDKDALFRSMSEYLRLNNYSNRYLSQCNNPESKHDFEFAGFKWTSRIDEMCNKFTVDLKKMADVSDKKIIWTAKDQWLDYQGALYSLPTGVEKHIIIAIDVAHNINAIEVTQERMEFCLNRLEYFADKFRECAEQDLWHEGKNFFEKQPLILNN